MWRYLLMLTLISMGYGEMDQGWVKTFFDKYSTDVVYHNGYIAVAGRGSNLSLWVAKLNPESGDTVWSRTYTTSIHVVGKPNITVDHSGNYVVTGLDLYDGIIVWKITPSDGQIISRWDFPNMTGESKLAVDRQGRYVLAGVEFYQSRFRFVVMRLDQNSGDTLWIKRFGTTTVYPNFYTGVVVDKDGNYLVATNFYSDSVWVLKMNPETGDTVWTKWFPDDFNSRAIGVENKGDYILGGCCKVAKIDHNSGDIIWQQPIEGFDHFDQFVIEDVTPDIHNYYVLTGYSGGLDAVGYLSILSPYNGSWIYRNVIDHLPNISGYFYLIATTIDTAGNYYFTGYVAGYDSTWAIIVKYSPIEPDIMWYQTYPLPHFFGFGHQFDFYFNNLVIDENGNYVLPFRLMYGFDYHHDTLCVGAIVVDSMGDIYDTLQDTIVYVSESNLIRHDLYAFSIDHNGDYIFAGSGLFAFAIKYSPLTRSRIWAMDYNSLFYFAPDSTLVDTYYITKIYDVAVTNNNDYLVTMHIRHKAWWADYGPTGYAKLNGTNGSIEYLILSDEYGNPDRIYLYKVEIDSNGNGVLGGDVESNDFEGIVIKKVNPDDGGEVWSTQIDSSHFIDLAIGPDGDYYVLGAKMSRQDSLVVVKVDDSDGHIVWQNRFSNSLSQLRGGMIQSDPYSGEIVVQGRGGGNPVVARFDPVSGENTYIKEYLSSDNFPYVLRSTLYGFRIDDEGHMITFRDGNNNGNPGVFILKQYGSAEPPLLSMEENPSVSMTPNQIPAVIGINGISFSPEPLVYGELSISVYSVDGRRVYRKVLAGGYGKRIWIPLRSGIYFVVTRAGGRTQKFKAIVVR